LLGYTIPLFVKRGEGRGVNSSEVYQGIDEETEIEWRRRLR